MVIVNFSVLCYATSDNVMEQGTQTPIQPRTMENVEQTPIEPRTDGVPVETALKSELEIIDNDYFYADADVNIENKLIDGNAFIAGKSIEMSNVVVTGSLYLAAADIKLQEVNCSGSISVAGKDIQIEKTNCKNIYSASQKLNLRQGTVLDKNLYSTGNRIEMNATVGNKSGIVGKLISFGSNATVGGRLDVVSETEPEIDGGANIPDYHFIKQEAIDDDDNKGFDFTAALMNIISYIILVVVTSAILVKIAPNFVKKTKIEKPINGLSLFGVGILTTIVALIAFAVLLATGVLARMAVSLLFIYIVIALFSTPVVCLSISKSIAEKNNKDDDKTIILYSALVALVTSIVCELPVIGGLVAVVMGTIGMGDIIDSLTKKD